MDISWPLHTFKFFHFLNEQTDLYDIDNILIQRLFVKLNPNFSIIVLCIFILIFLFKVFFKFHKKCT